MIGSYVGFVRAYWNHLLFGFLLMAMSSFGQTFFISLFGAHLRHAYGLSDGGLGTAYAAATFASAFTLPCVGRWIDNTTVPRYAAGVGLLLAAACGLMAVSTSVPLLVLALYMLRLGGQGLMVHASMTATARAVPRQAGQALGISNLGMPLGEAVLPLAAAFSMAAIGWRSVWLAGIFVILAGTAVAIFCRQRGDPGPELPLRLARPNIPEARQRLWRDPRILYTLPVILAPSFVTTGFFFHQIRLLEEKGWDLAWWASWFVGYAIARAVSMALAGPVIDRFGASRLLPFFLAPLALATVAVAFIRPAWGAPLYLIPTGISSGISATLLTALWVELYGPERLAEVRSTVAAANVIASGTAPTLMGFLIDAGVPLAIQANACLVFIIVASLVARRVRIYAPVTAQNTTP
jgi:MFS family permease